MTKEEYIDSCYKEKYTVPSWIFDVVAFDYNDGMKNYIGLEYNKAWPENDWFYVLLKLYNSPIYGNPMLFHDVQVYPDYVNKRRANDEERKMLLEELYKNNWKVVRKDDDGFVEYKIEQLDKKINI